MPSRVYMQVDPRADHSFRVPRPDLSVTYGTPNACNGCHDDKTPQWASDVIAEHFGGDRAPHFAETLILGDRQRFDAERALSALATDNSQPALVRSTAQSALGMYEFGYSQDAIVQGLRDPDPLIRLAAVENIVRLPAEPGWGALKRLLNDPVRSVRVEAGRIAAPYLAESLSPTDRGAIRAALDEYIETQTLFAEWPQPHTNIAGVHAAANDSEAAEAALLQALEIEPHWIPALVNLADLYRASNRDDAAGPLLKRAATIEPLSAAAAYALGLWYVRAGERDAALEQFRLAVEAAPNDMRNTYAYALALEGDGDRDQAIALLQRARQQFGDHRLFLQALMNFHIDAQNWEEALTDAQRLAELFGADYNGAIAQIRTQIEAR
jgi:tetratricopeptide (TPR) repeat protein